MRLRFLFPLLLLTATAHALDIVLPTPNDALLRPNGEESFFQPTVEGSVTSGMFGCVRRSGARFHEGVDIRCLKRDKSGECIDPVVAVADGEVAFVNAKPGLSNYGRYIVVEHRWDGVQVFTLYAHLRAIATGIATGQPVRKGQTIGTVGRSTNTREGISKDRAHVHFEINFMRNPNFRTWYAKRDPKAPPFGNFNGQNFVAIDPASLYRANAANPNLNFRDYIAQQPIAFTVLIGARPFPWLTTHPEQLRGRMPAAETIAYEIGATAWGLPVAVWPRGAADVHESHRLALQRGAAVLNRVNETALANANCRGLVRRSGRGWELGEKGRQWIELLTYGP